MMARVDEHEDTTLWAESLERVIRIAGLRWVDRVAVLAETVSTQDAAVRMAAGRPGLMVLAARQTAGRGRLGRRWSDPMGLGLAVTFALDGTGLDDATMSLAVGLAACRTVEHFVGPADGGAGPASGVVGPEDAGHRVGLRWPNDVMVGSAWIGSAGRAMRKAAGVLIERAGPMVYAGVGVNVLQTARDWPEELGSKAVSLREFVPGITRLQVAERLIQELDRALDQPKETLAEAWTARDMLVGSRATFEYDGQRYEGLVTRIDPTSAVCLQLASGAVQELPALTTSLVKE